MIQPLSILRPPKPDPRWLEPFLSYCHTKSYDKNVDFIRVGEPAESLHYLIEGSVAAVIDDEDRRELLLAYINKGEFIGEMGLFVPQNTRSVIIRTRTKCRVAEITYQRLDRLLDNELKDVAKDFLYAVGFQLSQRLRQTSRKVGHLAFLDVTGRIAGTLLDLCKQPDAMTHPDGMQIRVTRQEIGRIVGCSREMAGRVLKSLEEQGLINVKGKTIVVFGTR
jgi:CRP/FNR family cyclic AMP-dependent transcriptional regulator